MHDRHIFYDIVEEVAGEKQYLLTAEMASLLQELTQEIEIKTIPVLDGSKVIVKTPGQQKAWQQIQRKMLLRMGQRGDNTKHFTINFHQGMQNKSGLSMKAAGAALTLSLYMELKSEGTLKIHGEFLTKQDIDDILGENKKTVKKILDELKRTNVIKWYRQRHQVPITKGKNKGQMKVVTANTYTMDPSIMYMGAIPRNEKDKAFTKVFKEEAKRYLEFLSLEARGLLFKLLPYVHFQSYILSHHPNFDVRADEEKTFYENIKDPRTEKLVLKRYNSIVISDLVRISTKSLATVQRYIKEWENARVVLKNGRGERAVFLMNPNLFTRQEIHCPYAVSLMHIFNQVQPKKTKK